MAKHTTARRAAPKTEAKKTARKLRAAAKKGREQAPAPELGVPEIPEGDIERGPSIDVGGPRGIERGVSIESADEAPDDIER